MTENFACRLEATARRHRDKVALAWSSGCLTYAELDAQARGLARHLDARGVGAGDRIAVALPNGWPFVVALLGALKVGATVAPLNPLLTGEERAAILARLEPRLIVTEIAGEAGEWVTPSPLASPAIVLFTSGSTGQPRGALLSHAALAWANRSWAEPVMRLTPADVVLGVLPFPHSFGLNGALLAPLLTGASVVLVERFSADAVIEAIATHGVTVLPAVATMFRRLLDAPAFAARRLETLRLAVSGAAPCPFELAEEWRQRTGVRILRGYGMTELFRPISYLAGDASDFPDAIGVAVPGVELSTVDDEGQAVAAGEVGELLIRSPAVMDGYLGDPGETRAVLSDGWFRTGDLARVSADGVVSIVGRKKDLILRGGYSVSPAEIEAVLSTHPAVAEVAVVGLPHPELGEEVVAFVALRDGGVADEATLVAHCRGRLAAWKCPRRVNFLASLPRSATGKILKARLG